jgi:hypothetical protein
MKQKDLFEAINKLRIVGYQMYNICYSYGQEAYTATLNKQMMARLAREWDAADRAMLDLINEKGKKI